MRSRSATIRDKRGNPVATVRAFGRSVKKATSKLRSVLRNSGLPVARNTVDSALRDVKRAMREMKRGRKTSFAGRLTPAWRVPGTQEAGRYDGLLQEYNRLLRKKESGHGNEAPWTFWSEPRQKNIYAAHWHDDDDGVYRFHPIRASADYDPRRLRGAEGKRARAKGRIRK